MVKLSEKPKIEMPVTSKIALLLLDEIFESDAFIYFQSALALNKKAIGWPFQMFVQSHKLLSGTLTKFGYSNCVSVTQRIALRSNASGNGDQFAVLAPLARWRKSM